jgi:hypothetical protein
MGFTLLLKMLKIIDSVHSVINGVPLTPENLWQDFPSLH